MKVKFSTISEKQVTLPRAFKLTGLSRKHNFDSNKKKVELKPETQLNTLIINVANSEGKVKQTEFYFSGNKLVLSDYQKRQFSTELLATVQKIGEKVFKENSALEVAVYNEPQTPFHKNHVTPNDFYSFHHCPHRLWKDVHSDPNDRDPVNPFMRLLWEKGIQHEEDVIKGIGEYLDLSGGENDERAAKTIEAMRQGVPLIYHGLLRVDELMGEPDILQRQPDGQYYPVDIKSAMAFESGGDDFDKVKLKEYYAMQLCLYVDALMRLGFTKDKIGVILDRDKNEVIYDLNTFRNQRDKRTWWEVYQEKKVEVLDIIQNKVQNDPALFSGCKLCHWYSACKTWCTEHDHTSRVYKLGRSFSDTLREDVGITTVQQLSTVDIDGLMREKEAKKEEGEPFLKGIGQGHLEPMVRRARFLNSGVKEVRLLNPVSFPKTNLELHIDLETDPTQDIVYLHGVIERRGEKTVYHAFIAEEVSKEAEEKAFRDFWEYVKSINEDYIVYHYSHYEKTMYNKLREKYPDVASQEEMDRFFSPERCVDLYRIVDRDTDWPLTSYSLKDIAKFIGFEWRVENPQENLGEAEKASGAASIKWFNEWVEAKKSGASAATIERLLEKILNYNEDDCMATIVVKDYLEEQMQKYVSGLEKQVQDGNQVPDGNKEKSPVNP